MDAKNRELVKSILRRAMEEGREGRVKKIHERLKAAREIPLEHQIILFEVAMIGKAIPKSPFSMSLMVHWMGF